MKKADRFKRQSKPSFSFCWLLLVLMCTSLSLKAENRPFHSVYYHRLQGSFWAQLADDTGASPTPRETAIASIADNFKAIRALGFDTVTIGLSDSDNWVSQHGGGFSYDPANPAAARPEFAVAQEIVLRIAEANHLKVIFAIGFSEYRRSSDGRAAWAGLADEYDSTSQTKGAFDYIHGLIAPTTYYKGKSTTKLGTVGLTDGPVVTYVGDTRVRGWVLAGEWNVNVVNATSNIHVHERVFKKYWNFFYGLVHYHGANNAFASTYLIGQPGGGNAQVASIKAFKQWFAPASGVKQPDLVGVEFYGPIGYDLASIYSDLGNVVDAMLIADTAKYPHDFAIPSDKVFLGEGSTNQTSTPAINQYFQDVFQLLSDKALAGIQLWVTDTLGDSKHASGKPTLSSATPAYDLFTTTFKTGGVRTYADLPSGISWHGTPAHGRSYADPSSYPAYQGVQSAAYGQWTYAKPTNKGRWIQQAMADHTNGMNVRFFANPNPLQSSGASGSTKLYWDASRMPDVKTIEIHAAGVSGPVVAHGASRGESDMSGPAVDGSSFFLVDTSKGQHRLLATVTLSAH